MNFKSIIGTVSKYGSVVGKTVYRHRKGIYRGVKIATGVGSVGYAVYKAPDTLHEIEDAGVEKGRALTASEKVAIVLKNEWPALALAAGFVSADVLLDISNAKEIKTVVAENTSLLGQISEISNSYNMVNDIKNAVEKKFVEQNGKEALDEVTKPVREERAQETLTKLVSEDAIVPDANRLKLWNDIYSKTGDADYKIQEYYCHMNGQKVLSCNYWLKECNKEMQRIMSSDGGHGYVSFDNFSQMFGFREIKNGENWIWRDKYEWFDLHTQPIELGDGVAVCEILFGSEPYYDGRSEYQYI